MQIYFCFQNTIVFSKNLEMNCGTAAPTVSAAGNQRQREGLAVIRVRAGQNTALLRIYLQQITYLGMVRGERCRARQGASS